MTLTDRQQAVLHFIEAFYEKEGFPPSLREICKGLGLASPGSLIKHVRALESKGRITNIPGKKRAWKLTEIKHLRTIPLIGRIAAGTPLLAAENKEEDLPIDPNLFGCTDAFALKVKGDSMIDRKIMDGDLAVIKPQETGENGTVLAVTVQGIETEATLKIFRHTGNEIELRSANSKYEPMIFKGKDCSRVKIIGRLIGVIRANP